MKRQSVILVELNELCPSLMSRFMVAGRLPNFQRLYRESQVYLTDAEERAPFLEPWIQWVTLHSGMSYRDHGIFHLSDGHRLQQKCLWDILSDAGYGVWVCGSMNVRYDRGLRGMVLPDPWATEVGPSHPELEPYFEFVHRNVLEYTNDRVPLSPRDYAQFISFMARHGLSISTVRAFADQLVGERLGRGHWRRAVLLDKLQLDVFQHYYRALRPSFSTYFVNSTAHFQHLYWRNMEPELFVVKPSDAEQAEYQSAIRYGYEQMDNLLGRFFELAGTETTLVLCTALSQQPFVKYESDGGKVGYRPRDFERFIRFTGVERVTEVVPVMAENFHVRFGSAEDAQAGMACLERLEIAGRRALWVYRQGSSLQAGCAVNSAIERGALLEVQGAGTRAPFFDLFYQVEGMKSGMHHPDGLLWIRRPDRRHQVHPGKLPLTAVAPMVLDMFGVQSPAFMRPAPVVAMTSG
jgi:hypothetical protein